MRGCLTQAKQRGFKGGERKEKKERREGEDGEGEAEGKRENGGTDRDVLRAQGNPHEE